jgi:4-hydroxy-tetrahydrodipicolinate reductase
MKIAILGYGRMGKAIEQIALDRGHEVLARVNNEEEWLEQADLLKSCDAAIEFSIPEFAVANIRKCFALNLPVVVGTTGWYEHKESIIQEVESKNQTLFFASNFSIGVNIFFEINRQLARLMNPHKEYDVSIEEIHHIHKLDAPSGTAITIAEQIIDELDRKNNWDLDNSDELDSIHINAKRLNEVPGTHGIKFESDIDSITIRHEAKSRKGFALGAVLAAEFCAGKKGFLSMRDLLFPEQA